PPALRRRGGRRLDRGDRPLRRAHSGEAAHPGQREHRARLMDLRPDDESADGGDAAPAGRAAVLPDWWEPLASRAATARRADFSRWPTPPAGGRRSAVLVLLGEQAATGPDVLIVQRAATLRSHAG